jgi:hypothetical protein
MPRAERVDVADLDAGRDIEQLVNELLHVIRRQPRRAERTSISVAGKSAG